VSTVELLVARCAGLDVANHEVVACVRVPDGRGGRAQQVRTFQTFTWGLGALAAWLAGEGVTLGALGALEGSIAELDAQVDRVLAPFAEGPRPAGHHHRGGQAGTPVCMIGRDRGGHVGASHRLAPGVVGGGAARATTPTGGKRRSGTTTKGNRWLGEVLTRVRLGGGAQPRHLLSAQYWRLARRIGKKKAAIAVGHSILVIAWHLLTDNCHDQDLGGDSFVRRDTDRQRLRAMAQRQALGYRVVLQPMAA
jgi:transposase